MHLTAYSGGGIFERPTPPEGEGELKNVLSLVCQLVFLVGVLECSLPDASGR